jgi:hypothetical protein
MSTEVANAENFTSTVELKMFGGGGAMIFGDGAVIAADILKMESGTTRNGDAMLKVSAEQIETLKAEFEAAGIQFEQIEQREATISLQYAHAVVYGQAAQDAAVHLKDVTLTQTEQGKARLKVPLNQVGVLESALVEAGYKVKQENAPSQSPKVVVRASPSIVEVEKYVVTDASAQNVAKALRFEPCDIDRTPGGQPFIEFSPKEFKTVHQKLKDAGIDVSFKDFSLSATLSTYQAGGTETRAVITGQAALEVAAALGDAPEVGRTKPNAAGASQPKLTLTEAQIEPAKAALQALGYSVEVKALEMQKEALITTFDDGGACVFGEAARSIAEALGREVGETKKRTPMLKVQPDEIQAVKDHLSEQGFKLKLQPYESLVKQAAPPGKKSGSKGDRE